MPLEGNAPVLHGGIVLNGLGIEDGDIGILTLLDATLVGHLRNTVFVQVLRDHVGHLGDGKGQGDIELFVPHQRENAGVRAGSPRVASDRIERRVPGKRHLTRLTNGVREGVAADNCGWVGQSLQHILFLSVVEHDRRHGGRLHQFVVALLGERLQVRGFDDVAVIPAHVGTVVFWNEIVGADDGGAVVVGVDLSDDLGPLRARCVKELQSVHQIPQGLGMGVLEDDPAAVYLLRGHHLEEGEQTARRRHLAGEAGMDEGRHAVFARHFLDNHGLLLRAAVHHIPYRVTDSDGPFLETFLHHTLELLNLFSRCMLLRPLHAQA